MRRKRVYRTGKGLSDRADYDTRTQRKEIEWVLLSQKSKGKGVDDLQKRHETLQQKERKIQYERTLNIWERLTEYGKNFDYLRIYLFYSSDELMLVSLDPRRPFRVILSGDQHSSRRQ